MYVDWLPNHMIVDQEIRLWKVRFDNVPDDERPVTLATTIKQCDKSHLPNLFALLKIGCTLPVTSGECERSFSVLRRLKIWHRSFATTSRLTSLAIMNIYCGHKVLQYAT